ncbi:MAG: EF-hand domain-containing protein [Alphaproteobacteria bacterium]|nr:EF-hand domain-containing protein [Alphaproteobacteria bacterium]
MTKSFNFALLASFCFIGSAFAADDAFVIKAEDIKTAAIEKLHQQGTNSFEMFDIDSNGKISKTEADMSTKGLDMVQVPFYTPEDITKIKKDVTDAFNRFDENKDENLNKEEAEKFLAYIENMLANLQISKMDTDNDGNISDEEMMSFSRQLPSLEESMARLQEATKKLEEINKNPQQYLNNMVQNVGNSVNQEEYTQMDKDKNNQVNVDEYVDYMFNHPNNKELGFSKEDYKNIYQLMDTSGKGHISLEEYLDYNKKQFEEIMSSK